jgi:hypothetical protein
MQEDSLWEMLGTVLTDLERSVTLDYQFGPRTAIIGGLHNTLQYHTSCGDP